MNQPKRFIFCLICLIGVFSLVSCSSSNDSDTTDNQPVEDGITADSDTDDIQPAAEGALNATLDEAALAQLEGTWERRGYGDLYVYENNRTTWYTLTENTCLQVFSFAGLIGLSPDEVSQTRYELQGDELTLAFPGGAFVTRLQRQETVPARCNETVASDAQGVFDFMWETFDEYYAFFELRDVDWVAEYARQLPNVAAVTNDDALFALLSDLLSPIDDGHVFLANETNFFSPEEDSGALVELQSSFDAQNEVTDFSLWIDNVVDQFQQNIVSRLDAGSFNEQGRLLWGTAESGSVGYLFIGGMQGYASDDTGELLEDVSAAEDLSAASSAMDMAMSDFANTTSLIIDLRLNGGGSDAISLDFVRRFVTERQLALSKTARGRDYESAPVEAWLEPIADEAYLQPVTLIVGPNTASAAEIFAIPMQRFAQVSVIGENTAGILSDILGKPLPNGWEFSLSNEVYRDADGVSFEGVGITPDIEVPVFSVEAILAGMDPALDLALAQP